MTIYSFFGWAGETCVIAIKDRHYVNRGFLNLPLVLSYGLTAALLLTALPQLNNMLLQYLLCLITFRTVQLLCNQFVLNVSGQSRAAMEYTAALPATLRHLLTAAVAGICYAVYLVVHPLLFAAISLLPHTAISILAGIVALLLILDFFSVFHAIRTGRSSMGAQLRRSRTDRLSDRITASIRDRLHRAYPGILTPDPSDDGDHTFARGICFDKLVWVFLVSSFFGALIEMLYCYSIDGYFMNRSSLLYGTFSVVWGLGAAVLTVTLKNLAEKPDRYAFTAGFFIGGAYEYLCSVFTELVFGKVFWDYSGMPLNIGGRTNVLYCLFWGVLAVVWIKMLYPKLSDIIQLIPAVQGKIVTWLIVGIMACNCTLTAAAMVRYDFRQSGAESPNVIEAFLDERYDDTWMEQRWPNMKQAG
ncbi:MAG: hypothetical protein IJD81_08085 [Oscillospiraceae bacterium]|nr:hypothetical protein [Oscillospiraceae bacterium]